MKLGEIPTPQTSDAVATALACANFMFPVLSSVWTITDSIIQLLFAFVMLGRVFREELPCYRIVLWKTFEPHLVQGKGVQPSHARTSPGFPVLPGSQLLSPETRVNRWTVEQRGECLSGRMAVERVLWGCFYHQVIKKAFFFTQHIVVYTGSGC